MQTIQRLRRTATTSLTALVALLILLPSCATEPKKAEPRTRVGLPTAGGKGRAPEWKPSPKAAPQTARGKGQPWTIQCIELSGPFARDHVEMWARQMREMKGVNPRDVFTEEGSDGFWRLYYGTYYRKTILDTGGLTMPEELKRDLAFIRGLRSVDGQGLFLYALKVPKPLPCDERPEWLLTRVDAVYSLQVAVFLPTDECQNYRQAAVEYCAFLRDKGIEAYYHHSSASSVVTVGAFGEEVVTTKLRKFGSFAEHGQGEEVISEFGPEVEALRQKDELLRYNLVNGQIYRVQPKEWNGAPVAGSKPTPVASQLVAIPRPQASDAEEWDQP